MYDSPKEGESEYGIWHRYALMYNNEEVCLFASDALDAKLKHFVAGNRVNIRKEEYEPGKYGWNVIPEEGTSVRHISSPDGVQKISTLSELEIEKRIYWASRTNDKTYDIHKQVALKEACKMFGGKKTKLTEKDSETLLYNMHVILDVLEEFRDVDDDLGKTIAEEIEAEMERGTPPPIDDDDLPF
jgi:hypothetical protein